VEGGGWRAGRVGRHASLSGWRGRVGAWVRGRVCATLAGCTELNRAGRPLRVC